MLKNSLDSRLDLDLIEFLEDELRPKINDRICDPLEDVVILVGNKTEDKFFYVLTDENQYFVKGMDSNLRLKELNGYFDSQGYYIRKQAKGNYIIQELKHVK